jgi:hypothetical protein
VIETDGRSTAEVNRMTRDWIESTRGAIAQAGDQPRGVDAVA